MTNTILNLIIQVAQKLGEINAQYLNKQTPQLRKRNRIKTIQASLQIEGNTLSLDQVTALFENKRVIGPKKDVQEVINAIKVYEQINRFDFKNEKAFLKAHQLLMDKLINTNGQYRKTGVGIAKGNQLTHLAPPAKNIAYLMKDLFQYLKTTKDDVLISSAVFHYEMEFIHPFMDGNGRMGRLWQTLILMSQYPIFEFLPFETFISQHQKDYYQALSKSDKIGHSTPFIEFILNMLNQALSEVLQFNNRIMTDQDRIEYFISLNKGPFTRKDYMDVFKNISSASASRDLKKAVELNLLLKKGNKNATVYLVNRSSS